MRFLVCLVLSWSVMVQYAWARKESLTIGSVLEETRSERSRLEQSVKEKTGTRPKRERRGNSDERTRVEVEAQFDEDTGEDVVSTQVGNKKRRAINFVPTTASVDEVEGELSSIDSETEFNILHGED